MVRIHQVSTLYPASTQRVGFFSRAVPTISNHFDLKQEADDWAQEYALTHLTPELISQERKTLVDSPLPDGSKRSPATINRYTAVLSSTLGYAVKKLRWITENSCRNLSRLKESSGRDRILKESTHE